MTKTIKELAKPISAESRLEYEAVIHMFELLKFNSDNKSKIDREDLSKFSKKWGINIATSAKLLADCQLAIIDS